MKHLSLKIFGRVQGVFFRSGTKKEAEKLGLCGWVKNETDGSVSVEIEGERAQLEKFLRWCREGTVAAKVEDIKEEWSNDIKKYKNFEIIV